MMLICYLVTINLLALTMMKRDKQKAIQGEFRTPEATFLLMTVFGGGVGVLAGMMLFRHKTLHLKFTVGIPLLMAAEGWFFWRLYRLWQNGNTVALGGFLLFLACNLVWFVLCGRDKAQSKKHRPQISNAMFLLWGLLGCAPGIFLGCQFYHHKTKKPLVALILPLIAVVQCAVLLILLLRLH